MSASTPRPQIGQRSSFVGFPRWAIRTSPLLQDSLVDTRVDLARHLDDYPDEEALLRALDESQEALEHGGVPFLVMGGIASAILGRPRWTRDIDLFVRLEDAGKALETLADAGFETWVEDQHWLAKAKK